LRERLLHYPDQRLASNVLEGVRLEADLELMTVLSPQLVSIGEGYDSVQKTVRDLKGQGFYDFFKGVPYWPIVIVGQGSRIKKLGANKYRRTSNFSGPHKLLTDRRGRRAVPINEASRCYLVPEWLAKSRQLEVRAWSTHRYAHVPTATRRGEKESPTHKFPKERKPAVTAVLNDMAILLRASLILNEPIFVWVEDAAFYFNQFGYAPEELWKSNLVVNARLDDVARDGSPFQPGQLVFISEKRLGFGSYASSNIAQRFSNALVGWTLQEFDVLEDQARHSGDDPRWTRRVICKQIYRDIRKSRRTYPCSTTRNDAFSTNTPWTLPGMQMHQARPYYTSNQGREGEPFRSATRAYTDGASALGTH
jgi:hypothetical protein